MPLVLVAAGVTGTQPLERPQEKALRAYAVAQLAQREYSRSELRRKLLEWMRARAAKQSRDPGGSPAPCADPREEDDAAIADPQRVEAILDWLEAHGYLSEQRFIESRVRLRSERFGNLRIRQELAQHGLALPAQTEAALIASEFERAQAIWERKFNGGAGTPEEAAKQARFLAARGFSREVIRRVLRTKRCAEPVEAAASSLDEQAAPRKARATLPR